MNKYLQRRRLRWGNLCLCAIFLLFSSTINTSGAYAQETPGPKIALVIKKGQMLKAVFGELQSKSDYRIIYDPEIINDKAEPGVQVFNNETVSAILRKLGFTFSINNKSIILGKPVASRAIRPVTGRVTDSLGIPLPGASIRVKNGAKGSSAGADGRYAIETQENDILIVSMIGYTSREIVVKGRGPFDISLRDDNATLNEVVVVGYGTQKKANLTGAVSTVNMDVVLGDRPVSSTGVLLEGVVPGLQVVTGNGAPGSSKGFNVRGGTDIPATGAGNTISSQGPLILVDNVPLNAPLSMLDPNDIETVTVLKDAGSAAIYGARSAFGVVLITTKKGKKNQKASFNYSNNLTLSSPMNLPQKATVRQTIQSYKDMGTTGYWTGQDVDTWLDLLGEYEANPGNYPENYALVNGIRYELGTTDAFKDLLGKTAPQFQHNLAVSGGSDKISYRISGGAVNENGILAPDTKTDYYKRYNVQSALTADVNKWLSFQLNASLYNSLRSVPGTPAYAAAAGYAPYTSMADSITYNGATIISSRPSNRVKMSSPTLDRFDDTRVTGRTVLKPLKGLVITGDYTFDNLRNLNTSYDKIATFIDSRDFAVNNAGSAAFKKINEITDYKAINVFANYSKSINKHHFGLLAGFNQEENIYEQEWVERTLPISGDLPSISQGTGPITGDDNYSEYAIRGAFGRLNYDYDGRYMIEINGRNDASSKFPKGHRSGFFPSFSAGWVLSREKFMNWSDSWLSEFKLRGSFGSVGNQNINPYQFVPGLSSYYALWLNGNSQVTSLNPPDLVSSNFTWATVQTADAGFDFGLWGNKLTGNVDFYQRDTKNMLYKGIQLPEALGSSAPLQNVAALRSKGYEIQLNWNDKIGAVSYRISANLYDYTSKITKIQNEAGLLAQYYEGQQLGEMYGYVTDRLYITDDFVPGTLNSNLTGGTLKPGIPKVEGSVPNPGDVLYKDLDGNGLINAGSSRLSDLGDQKIIGNNSLRYQYGISGAVSYRNFDFSFVTTGIGKQDQFRANLLSFPNFYAFGTIYEYQLDYWTPTNTDAFYGRTYDQAKGNQKFNQYQQTKYLLNGANLRVKNLTLAYTFPQSLTQKIHVDKLRVFGSVENPFTIDHLPKGSDPAISPSGNYGYDYPFMRLYSFGVNLSF